MPEVWGVEVLEFLADPLTDLLGFDDDLDEMTLDLLERFGAYENGGEI